MLVISQDGTKRVETETIYCCMDASIKVVTDRDGNNEEFARYNDFNKMVYVAVEFYEALKSNIQVFQFPKEAE